MKMDDHLSQIRLQEGVITSLRSSMEIDNNPFSEQLRVLVKAFAGLAAQMAGGDHPA